MQSWNTQFRRVLAELRWLRDTADSAWDAVLGQDDEAARVLSDRVHFLGVALGPLRLIEQELGELDFQPQEPVHDE